MVVTSERPPPAYNSYRSTLVSSSYVPPPAYASQAGVIKMLPKYPEPPHYSESESDLKEEPVSVPGTAINSSLTMLSELPNLRSVSPVKSESEEDVGEIVKKEISEGENENEDVRETNNEATKVDEKPGGKSRKSRKPRTIYSSYQIRELNHKFNRTQYLALPERARLAAELGLTQTQIKIWFQNRRSKLKKHLKSGGLSPFSPPPSFTYPSLSERGISYPHPVAWTPHAMTSHGSKSPPGLHAQPPSPGYLMQASNSHHVPVRAYYDNMWYNTVSPLPPSLAFSGVEMANQGVQMNNYAPTSGTVIS